MCLFPHRWEGEFSNHQLLHPPISTSSVLQLYLAVYHISIIYENHRDKSTDRNYNDYYEIGQQSESLIPVWYVRFSDR